MQVSIDVGVFRVGGLRVVCRVGGQLRIHDSRRNTILGDHLSLLTPYGRGKNIGRI